MASVYDWLFKRVMALDVSDDLLMMRVWDDGLGIWLTLAQANIQDEAMAQGIPVLRGPYVIDYTDIPHDGDTVTLWTPQAGDVLIVAFVEASTHVAFAPNVDGYVTVAQDPGGSPAWQIGTGPGLAAGMISAGSAGQGIFTSADPVQALYTASGDGDLTAGHFELYTLVARAVAP